MDTGKIDPFAISEILEMILITLDTESLRQSRLVCKTWDEASVSVISKHKPPILLPPLELQGTESVTELLQVLRKASCPGIVLQNLKSEGEELDDPLFQELLQEFGWTVKYFQMEYSTCSYKLLKSILTQWCLNLEELKIETFPSVIEFKKFYLNDNQLCNLRRLTFDSGGYSRCRSADVHFLTTIVGATANLKYLKIGSISGQQSMIAESFKALKHYPKITEGLEEIWINCDSTPECNPLKSFLSIKLGPNLKIFSLQTRKRLPKTEVTQLLNNLKDSLESLSLKSKAALPRRILDSGNNERIRIPVMPKLKHFVNLVSQDVHLDMEELVTKMPKLESLVITPRLVHSLLAEPVDELFSGNFYEHTRHLGLKKLVFFGDTYAAETLTKIGKLFPNLTSLAIGVGFHLNNACPNDDITSLLNDLANVWFMLMFLGFTEIKNLKSLVIDFGNLSWDKGIILNDAFQALSQSRTLRELTIVSGSSTEVGPSFANTLIGFLAEARRLQSLTLVRVKMQMSTEKMLTESKEGSAGRVNFTYIDPRDT